MEKSATQGDVDVTIYGTAIQIVAPVDLGRKLALVLAKAKERGGEFPSGNGWQDLEDLHRALDALITGAPSSVRISPKDHVDRSSMLRTMWEESDD